MLVWVIVVLLRRSAYATHHGGWARVSDWGWLGQALGQALAGALGRRCLQPWWLALGSLIALGHTAQQLEPSRGLYACGRTLVTL